MLGLVVRKRTLFLCLGLLFLMAVFLAAGFGYYLITPARKGGPDRVFTIREGLTLNQVASELESGKLIESKRLFETWARAMGYSKHIKAGEYRLSPAMSPLKILDTLKKGLIITYAVTVPEGYTLRQIAELLARKGLADEQEFLRVGRDPGVVKHYGLPGPGLEGYLYPDTYQLSRGLSALTIMDVMVKRFRNMVTPLQARIQQSGLTMGQMITLASIVEKETGLAQERPVIASVFLNRLKKGMRLDSDPTVIYGLEHFDGNLTREELVESSPYNTYLIQGLPPGPIANPGLDAIKAVLYPAHTNYLYFVSKNDGSHFFSKTLSGHNQAVDYYQRRKGKRPKETS